MCGPLYKRKILVDKHFSFYQIYFLFRYVCTGCPKKRLFCGFLALTPLWKGLEIKVGGVSKNSGNSLSDRHQNFSIWPIRSWENWVQRWQPYLKNLDKNGGIFFLSRTDFLGHPVVFWFVVDNKIHILNIMWNPCLINEK